MEPRDTELTRVLRAPDNSYDVETVLAAVHARHQRRTIARVGAPLAAAAAVVAIIFTAAVLGQPHDAEPAPAVPPTPAPPAADTTGAVPWSDRTDYVDWAYTHPTAAPCRAADLKPLPSNVDGAGQHLGWFLGYRNQGDTACTLSGYPTVQTRASGGSWATIAIRQGAFFPDGYTPGTVSPGADPVELTLEFSAGETTCSPPPGGLEIRLVLDDGTAIPVIAPEGGEQACAPIAVGQWHAGLAEQPERFSDLQVRMETPAAVRPGSVTEYIVTLTNLGDRPVDLTPCPGYEQTLSAYDEISMSAGKTLVQGRWQLNCDSTPVIEPGASVRYAMRLDIPADVLDSPEVFLHWGLVDLQPDSAAQAWLKVVP